MDAWLEVAILKCPNCGNLLAEPVWFLELEQDITCSVCRKTWQASRNLLDKVMLRFEIEGKKVKSVSFSRTA
ncbi:MAG: hypothetical protein DRP12_00420 [Candidatus Aenigmatarchaeota archaeon]|nr:MAG: hypothetical protein DRP12_00420 [Candidatus Aenigmarchaeota archaeon]